MAEKTGMFQAWANHLHQEFGGDCRVEQFHDEEETQEIAIFFSNGKEGVIAASIGLMLLDQSTESGQPIHTEILFQVRGKEPEELGSILATIGFSMMKQGWKVAPGVVFEQMISIYLPSLELKHVLFLPPVQWDESMHQVDLNETVVFPLVAVPISDAERELVRHKGIEALGDLWEETRCDFRDWDRKSAI